MKIHIKFTLGFFILFWGISLKSQVTIADGLPGCLPVVNQEGVACTVGGVGTTFFGLNAMNQFVSSFCAIIGLVFGGLFYDSLGLILMVILNAASFFIAAFVEMFI